MKIKMSQARYNDLVYMGLRYGWFKPMFGEGSRPRECDVRICMQLGNAEMLEEAGPEAAVLLPDEKAPADHGRMLVVDTYRVLIEMRNFMEAYWLERGMDEEWWDWVKRGMWPVIIKVAMATREERCAKG